MGGLPARRFASLWDGVGSEALAFAEGRTMRWFLRVLVMLVTSGVSTLVMAQGDPAALRSVEEWERLGLERARYEHEHEYLPRSRAVNSWQFYNLAYGLDGNTAFFEATGKREHLDRALTYAENCVASARPSRSLPPS